MTTIPFNVKHSEKPKANDTLQIRKKLPQIIIPNNKIEMFVNWYNEDLRFQDTIPKAFEEGYLIIENDLVNVDITKCSEYIKGLAKQLHGTYRQVEDRLNGFLQAMNKVTLYFKFVDNHVFANLYGSDNIIISSISFDIGAGESEIVEYKQITEMNEWDDVLNEFNIFMVVLLSASMWYICTTKRTTTYYYENRNDQPHLEKEVRKVRNHKTITTPIYDMNKIKKVKVEHLIKRRKGWTYTHSFQVHGHYRHYRDGKVVFVNSYIKGQNKPLQNQVITLNPEEVK